MNFLLVLNLFWFVPIIYGTSCTTETDEECAIKFCTKMRGYYHIDSDTCCVLLREKEAKWSVAEKKCQNRGSDYMFDPFPSMVDGLMDTFPIPHYSKIFVKSSSGEMATMGDPVTYSSAPKNEAIKPKPYTVCCLENFIEKKSDYDSTITTVMRKKHVVPEKCVPQKKENPNNSKKSGIDKVIEAVLDGISENPDTGNDEPLNARLQAIKDDILANITLLSEEGFNRSIALVERRQTDEADLASRRAPDPLSVLISNCKALRLLETAKTIIERHDVSEEESHILLSNIELPASIVSEIEAYCQTSTAALGGIPGPLDCSQEKYLKHRTFTGECNNLNNQMWGKRATNFIRLLTPMYEDDLGSPRSAGLPQPRKVSIEMSATPQRTNPLTLTQMLKAWGQFIDHDITMAPETPLNGCCVGGKKPAADDIVSEDCIIIDVEDDPFYLSHGIECLGLKRSLPLCDDCILGNRREQMSMITPYIDGSGIYGSTEEKANNLRAFRKGQLKVNDDNEETSCTQSCPYSLLPNYDTVGENPDPDFQGATFPFSAGDIRVNEQPGLTSMHTMFLRFHNKLANKIGNKYRRLSDEQIYQETRRIVGAIVQHITYSEFLPVFFGRKNFNRVGLGTRKKRHSCYDDSVNPSIANAFSAAAYRVGHTFIAKHVMSASSSSPFLNITLHHNFFSSIKMKTDPRLPSQILEGETRLNAEGADAVLVDDITNLLYTKTDDLPHGLDLYSLNIQRGRDHGLPPYNYWRKRCGLKKFTSFQDLKRSGQMQDEVVDAFKRLYSHVDDIDLFPAALAEKPIKGGIVGKVLFCILSDQFLRLKYGDRFWHETKNAGFTESSLKALKKTTLASIMCETTSMETVQKQVIIGDKYRFNRRKPCSEVKKKHSPLRDVRFKAIAKSFRIF